MNLAKSFADLLATSETPELGPGPRTDVTALPALQTAIDHAFANARLDSQRARAARALILLWHDHHDAAHQIVQDEDTADASYVHAILHRREPDYGNAKYWFRRVGLHQCYESLVRESEHLLHSSRDEALHSKLLSGGKWDAFAFVDACESASRTGRTVEVLRRIQAAEFAVLLEFLTRA